ncbi:hypothetical protein PV328_011999, partial [Microctonus aethiopoides]
ERLEEMNNNRETTTENVNHDNELTTSQPKVLREAQNLALKTEKEEITSNYIYKKPVLDQSKIPQNSRNTQNTTRNYNKQVSNQLNTEKNTLVTVAVLLDIL